jgi:hypothetical protein
MGYLAPNASAPANLLAPLARQGTDNTQQAEQAGTQECMPCGGRGTLISKLGGEESVVRCPWCEGSGERRKGVDAQAHWGDQAAVEGEQEREPDATV